jgi:mRNA interferase MazF
MAIRRGEIYFVNLNPVTGREQAGQRPVLVLSVDEINRQPLVVTVVVGTNGQNVTRDYAVNVRVPAEKSGLPIETVFLCFQIRSLDPKRFPEGHAGVVARDVLSQVETAVRRCLGL